MKKQSKILLIGCGELGSRHLQAITSLDSVKEIYVLDDRAEALALGQKRLAEIKDFNKAISFHWIQEPTPETANGDLCLVATQATGRCSLVKRVTRELGYQTFLIEKIVAQSVDEYLDLMSFVEKHKLAIWVNCKTRTYSIHKRIKKLLPPDEPFIFSRISGNDGLANNGVHTADLFAFYDGTTKLIPLAARIDPVLHPSKRGKMIFDLSGTLHAMSDKGSDFTVSFAPTFVSPDHISIVSSRGRFIIDHIKRFFYQSLPENDWEWQRLEITDNWMVSCMTKAFVTDILEKNSCELPTLAECWPAHQYILSELLGTFKKLDVAKDGLCPVT